MRNFIGYCRAFHLNHTALACEHGLTGSRFPRYTALRQMLTDGSNPFLLSDLATDYILTRR